MAKVYVSIFPDQKSGEIIKGIVSNTPLIKHELSQITKNQLRRMPDLQFYNDDSLQYIDSIEKSLKGEENPIENPELLQKRKKK